MKLAWVIVLLIVVGVAIGCSKSGGEKIIVKVNTTSEGGTGGEGGTTTP